MSLFRRTVFQGYQALGLEAQLAAQAEKTRRQAEIMRLEAARRRDRSMDAIGLTTPPTIVDAPSAVPIVAEADRVRAALDPNARAAGFERWCAEQYELQEARRRGGA